MRTRRLATLAAAAACAVAAGLSGAAGAAPALAQRTAATGAQAAQASSALAAGGPPYTAFAYSQVSVSGNASPGALSSPTTYLPASCWMEPRFTGGQSYHQGDPQPSATGDADSYWWWFASQNPALYGVLGRISGLKQAINKVFKAKQGSPGWWWVPSWVRGGVTGFACATGLVNTLNFSAQYLEFQAPQRGGPDTPGHPVDGHILADLARAELVLPAFTISTSPGHGVPSDVNLPVWVSVTYPGGRTAADTATEQTPAGDLMARVFTSQPQISLSVSSPGQAQVYNQCGALGSPYTGNASAVPPCGVTFLAPSTGGPCTITVTATWRVWWTASDTPGQHLFTSPPWPRPVQTGTAAVTVREVQSVNGPSPSP